MLQDPSSFQFWVCIQWCMKCRAVGGLNLPSHNALHGLMPPLAGKWVRGGGGVWGVQQCVCWKSIPTLQPWTSELGRDSVFLYQLDSPSSLVIRARGCGMSSSWCWFIRFPAESRATLTRPESRNWVKGMVCFLEVKHGLIVPPNSNNPWSAWSSLTDQYVNVWDVAHSTYFSYFRSFGFGFKLRFHLFSLLFSLVSYMFPRNVSLRCTYVE